MKHTKQALFHSIVALILCCSMLVGTTFAWFTDEVTSGVNKIQAGNLDVDLVDAAGNSLEGTSLTFMDVTGNTNILWEPGCTFKTQGFRVANKGSLALNYTMYINGLLGDSILLDVIEFSLQDANGYTVDIDNFEGKLLPKDTSDVYYLVGHMDENAGNEYQNKTLTGLGITVYAAQRTSENDSFGNDYDKDSKYPNGVIDFAATTSVTADPEGKLDQAITIGDEDDIRADVPAGALLADGATDLGLSVKTKSSSDANLKLANGESIKPLDIKMPGLDPDNQELIKVTIPGLLKKGLNFGNAKMYHVENGTTIEMTQVENLDALTEHNQFYYDPATGDVTICTKSFSEYVAVTDNKNLWKGGFNTTWYNTTATEFTLTTADQLAGFGAIVDGTADGIEADTFAGKIIKLDADIDLSGGYSLNPIGCGYVDSSINSNGVTGRPFMGTFDGQGHTISNLYQNGWELGLSYCNLGGGLFASVAGTADQPATIKNLTISGANIVMECVEMGVLVGLSQGVCNYTNINIYGSYIANYQKATGGVVGEVSPLNVGDTTYSAHTFTNVTVGSNTTVGTLWGDFDAPVGGVVGAKWGNDTDTTDGGYDVYMNKCNISCHLDVYNDVTSSYQWYAYRRSGMLIGNTEEVAADNAHLAAAPFLKCEGVVVIYDDSWTNYHYCEFTRAGQPNSRENWPWVRVEAGKNCNAYSNPRFGYRYDAANNEVHDSLHTHSEGEGHLEMLEFHQLYGGGQGVYGQSQHNGVTEGKYTITYMDNGTILAVQYVTDQDVALLNASAFENAAGNQAKWWVDANGTQINVITGAEAPANPDKNTIYNSNDSDIILYPQWPGKFAVRFLDAEKNVLYYQMFTENGDDTLDTGAVENARVALQNQVDATAEVIIVGWDTNISEIDLKTATGDIVVQATYSLADAKMTLEPVYNTNGKLIEYKLADYDISSNEYANIIIPERVGLVPVVAINNDVFAGYTNLVSVEIPDTITSIGSNAFEDGANWLDGGRSTITIYYKGDSADWKRYMDNFYQNDRYYSAYNTINADATGTILTDGWDDGLGDGSRIFFLGADGHVDLSKGYWELYKHREGFSNKYTWVYHSHEYVQGVVQTHNGCDYVSSEQYTNYISDQINGATRPDAEYWTTTATN